MLQLPTDTGSQIFDAVEFALDDTNPGDRFVVSVYRPGIAIDPGPPAPVSCLRLHRCSEQEVPPLPRPAAARPQGRADFAAARRLDTAIHLYRAQRLGALRSHAGQRTYEPVVVPARLASIAGLGPERCALCRAPLSPGIETIVVGTVEADPSYPVRACRPSCPDRSSARS